MVGFWVRLRVETSTSYSLCISSIPWMNIWRFEIHGSSDSPLPPSWDIRAACE